MIQEKHTKKNPENIFNFFFGRKLSIKCADDDIFKLNSYLKDSNERTSDCLKE